jgi:hypothetical protein
MHLRLWQTNLGFQIDRWFESQPRLGQTINIFLANNASINTALPSDEKLTRPIESSFQSKVRRTAFGTGCATLEHGYDKRQAQDALVSGREWRICTHGKGEQ